MQVNRQTCQACGSREARNILVREAGKPITVYVRCGQCGQLIASYELKNYYHHGKGIESYLNAHGVGAEDSGRRWLAEFKQAQERALSGYQAALEKLAEDGKDI
jgi:hypothetical protein